MHEGNASPYGDSTLPFVHSIRTSFPVDHVPGDTTRGQKCTCWAHHKRGSYFMKLFKTLALTAAAAFGIASVSAQAATINISGVSAVNGNVSNESVDQAAVALNANIGSVVDSVVDVNATAANNVATTEVDTTQIATGLSGNLSLVSAGNLNVSVDSVNQLAVAGNLSGNLHNTSLNVGGTAANNVASATVITVQK